MATSQFAEAAQREVTCPICFEFFVDPHIPKDLECPHTCCQVCLQKIVTQNPRRKYITCPMRCSKKTRLPAGGVKNLRTNLHIQNLAELHPTYAEGTKPVPKCAKHNENMHLYCTRCNTLVCQNCVILYHKGTEHDIVDVCETTKKLKEELKTMISDSGNQIKSHTKLLGKMQKCEADILTAVEIEKQKITKHRDEFIQAVNEETERCSQEVQRAGDAKLDEIRTARARLEESLSNLSDAYDTAKQAGESSDHVWITQHVELVEKMKKELSSVKQLDLLQADLRPRRACFVKSSTVAFGAVVRLYQTLDTFESATHIACSCSTDRLLAVSDNDGMQVTIYKFDNELYKKKLTLELNTVEPKPNGVVFCPDGKLWVARVTGIEVYSSTGKYEKTINTKQDTEMQTDEPPCKKDKTDKPADTALNVYSLAVTADGSKILAGDVMRNVITVHDLTGTIVSTLKTSIRPCKIAAIENTHVAVSAWNRGRVIAMNIETGQKSLHINIDRINALSYDAYSDTLVCGRKKGKLFGTGMIEQYSLKTGLKMDCIADNLYAPSGIAFTPGGLLFAVADKKSVKIYEIK